MTRNLQLRDLLSLAAEVAELADSLPRQPNPPIEALLLRELGFLLLDTVRVAERRQSGMYPRTPLAAAVSVYARALRALEREFLVMLETDMLETDQTPMPSVAAFQLASSQPDID